MSQKVEDKVENPKKEAKADNYGAKLTELVKKARIGKRHLIVTGLVLLIAIIIGAASYEEYYENRIVPHTIVSGVSVGGMTQAQAQKVLTANASKFGSKTLTLSYKGNNWQLMPSTIGLSLQTDQAIAQAYQTGRSGSKVRNLASKFKALFVKHTFTATVAPLPESGTSYLETNILTHVEIPAVATTLSFVPGKVTVVPGKSGTQLDSAQFNKAIELAFVDNKTLINLELDSTGLPITNTQAEGARAQAEQILSSAWTIQANGQNFTLSSGSVAKFLATQVTGNMLSLTIDQTKLASYLSSNIASKIGPVAVNATLAVNNGVVSVTNPGTNGVSLDSGKTASAITTALLAPTITTRTITGTTQVVEPAVTGDNFASLGITQLIGTGTTSFSGSPANREENIHTGVSAINGQLVAPGAQFSTVGALGPIDSAHGYVSALVILGGETLPEDGGGLCQVSTTMFRAALNAGLTITARTAHAYEVSYYQRGVGPGLDATIYDPSPDLKWLNDTGHYIFIQGIISGTNLTFNLYGTSDGRTSAITGPFTLSTSQPTGAPIYVNTDTLPVGKTELIDPPVPGAKTTATYTVTRNGVVIDKQVFNSNYKAMPAQYLVGAPATPATPTP
jgi:vancomycin resistance protein YoaR